MEVPTVFRKLGLAGPDDVWIIQKAVYGLTSSPRDWCLYRDETLPTMSWRRNRQGQEVDGSFIRTPDDNVWRLEEVDRKTGEKFWAGLMSVYVDDLLVTAEDSAAKAAIQAIADSWCSEAGQVLWFWNRSSWRSKRIHPHPKGVWTRNAEAMERHKIHQLPQLQTGWRWWRSCRSHWPEPSQNSSGDSGCAALVEYPHPTRHLSWSVGCMQTCNKKSSQIDWDWNDCGGLHPRKSWRSSLSQRSPWRSLGWQTPVEDRPKCQAPWGLFRHCLWHRL